MDREPLTLSIQHFCLQDGPGVRSLVFFKGCPLRCAWCQNPESWSPEPEPAFKGSLCLGCGECVAQCPEQALARPGERDPLRCRLCFTCVEACPSGALARHGEPRGVDELVEALRPEFPLLRDSGGGVTLSGGEPTLFPALAARLAARLREEGIHVALETCGHFAPDADFVVELLDALDLVLFDVKLFDEPEHRRLCGAGNARIKRNLRLLAERAARGEGPLVWPRLPLVPGITDGQDNLRGWAGLLVEAGLTRLTLVPAHALGESKRAWLGLPPGPAIEQPTDGQVEAARALLAGAGVAACLPADEDWGSA